MNWVRTDLYTPRNPTVVSSKAEEEESRTSEDSSFYPASPNDSVGINENIQQQRTARCPLHKHIRNGEWSLAKSIIQHDTTQITHQNRMGWSSLVLAIYHSAPVEFIAEMLNLISEKEQEALLSKRVPNGSRLCLHFAARYSDNIEVFKLLIEPHPSALLAKSTDGSRPVDRAIYYRKDCRILEYLSNATDKEMILANNQKLRRLIIQCCEKNWMRRRQALSSIASVDENDFILVLYGYLSEREMMGVFWNTLSYVGAPTVSRGKAL